MQVQMNSFFQEGLEVIDLLERAGYQAYFVGGCVRDLLLQEPVHDLDLCTSATPEEVLTLFPKSIPTGLKHGTVTVLWRNKPIEVTTFRTDASYVDHRRPEQVRFVSTLAEDSKRRDFTINALALDKEGHVLDYHNGLSDLRNKLIRTVGQPKERFAEDALRLLRAIRFSAQLGFMIEEQTYKSLESCQGLLAHIALERVSTEFYKLLKAKEAELGLRALVDTGIAQSLIPFSMVALALEELSKLPLKRLTEEERWLSLLLLAREEERALFFLRRLTLPKAFSRQLRSLLRAGYDYKDYVSSEDFSDTALIELGLEQCITLLKVNAYLNSEALKGKGSIEAMLQAEADLLRKRYEQLPLYSFKDLALTGRELLKLYPERQEGPWLSQALTFLFHAVINQEVENKRDRLIAFLMKEEKLNEPES